MSEKKYKLIRVDERHHNGESGLDLPTYRIMATRTIKLIDGNMVRPGDLGGFVDGERCLSQEGACWVADDARVYGRSRVEGDALVKEKAVLGEADSSLQGATASGKSMVSGFANVVGSTLEDYARVDEHAHVLAGCIIDGRAHVTQFARMHFSTASDDSHVGGRAELTNTSMWGRSFAMGEASLDNCNMRDKAVVTDFVQAKNVDVMENSFLTGFASALAATDKPRRRGGRAVSGTFGGTADALASEQDSAARLHREGQTLVVPPDDFKGMVESILASDVVIIDEEFADAFTPVAPDTGLDAQSLSEARGQATSVARECGAATTSGARCTQSISPDAQQCRAGHKVAGRR